MIVTRRGKPVARIIPESGSDPVTPEPYSLRGSLIFMSEDFDEPIDDLWEADQT